MKKLLSVILSILLLSTLSAYGESGSHQDWYDHSYSEGYEAGKKDEKYDSETSFGAYESKELRQKYDELQTVGRHAEAEEYLKAAQKGFYAGYRSGHYREKESELVKILEKKTEKDIKITDFKFGTMEDGKGDVVVEETRIIKVPTVGGKKNYFGYTFDYSGNQVSDKMVVVINLPGPPTRDLGPNYYANTNSVIAEHKIALGSGHFANKWYFFRGDLTGKFRVNVYIGNRLVKRLWFDAVEGR